MQSLDLEIYQCNWLQLYTLPRRYHSERITSPLLILNFPFHFSFRSGITFISGIFMYTITWILLKTDGGDQRISPSQWRDFMVKLISCEYSCH